MTNHSQARAEEIDLLEEIADVAGDLVTRHGKLCPKSRYPELDCDCGFDKLKTAYKRLDEMRGN